MFLALIWGIVHSCRSYMTREMITKLKNFDRIFLKELQIWHFLKNQIFRFLVISLIIFDLQECTIPQIKAKDILFWPSFVRFLAKINASWDRKQWSCLVFSDSDFKWKLYFEKYDMIRALVRNFKLWVLDFNFCQGITK